MAPRVPPGVDLGACDVSLCYPRDAGCGALPAVAEASCRPLLWQAAADGSGTTYEAFCRLANVAVGAAVLRVHRAAVLSCVRARARALVRVFAVAILRLSAASPPRPPRRSDGENLARPGAPAAAPEARACTGIERSAAFSSAEQAVLKHWSQELSTASSAGDSSALSLALAAAVTLGDLAGQPAGAPPDAAAVGLAAPMDRGPLSTLTRSIMLGIHWTVSAFHSESLAAVPPNFAQTAGGRFPPAGMSGGYRPPHTLGGELVFTDYAPNAFSQLRRAFGIGDEQFLSSLGGARAFLEFASNSKSGSFFFYSYDGAYMIKSMSGAEFDVLRDILPRYFRHMLDHAGRSLLTRFCGMYSIELAGGGGAQHFVVMQSVFAGAPPTDVKFDLKGSTVNRMNTCGKEKSKCVFKDVDFINSGARINLGGARARFLAAVADDAEFLRSEGIMDYSLLLGIRYAPPGEKIGASPVGFVSADGRSLYCVGVIDILQKYTAKKKGERLLKTVVKRQNGAELSSAEPGFYARRFVDFIASKTI